jgi:hypothetical protein
LDLKGYAACRRLPLQQDPYKIDDAMRQECTACQGRQQNEVLSKSLAEGVFLVPKKKSRDRVSLWTAQPLDFFLEKRRKTHR